MLQVAYLSVLWLGLPFHLSQPQLFQDLSTRRREVFTTSKLSAELRKLRITARSLCSTWLCALSRASSPSMPLISSTYTTRNAGKLSCCIHLQLSRSPIPALSYLTKRVLLRHLRFIFMFFYQELRAWSCLHWEWLKQLPSGEIGWIGWWGSCVRHITFVVPSFTGEWRMSWASSETRSGTTSTSTQKLTMQTSPHWF